MSIPDFINGAFESCGGLFCLMNCAAVIKDKGYRGIYVPAQAFFTSWGVWNLYYYPHLGQWLSFTGGLVIVISNAAYVGLCLYYGKRIS